MLRKLVASAVAVPLLCALGASLSSAREPEAVFFRVIEADRAGSFHPGLTPGGDTKVQIELFPSDEDLAKSPLLVVFPGCGDDPSTPNRPILNLEDVLRRSGTPGRSPSEWEDPGPRWRICPSDSAILLEGGQARSLSLSVDFLRAVSEGVSPRLNAEVHILSEDDLAKIDPAQDIGCQWASLVGGRAPTAHLTIDLYYRLSDKGDFLYGGYHDVFGKPGPDPVQSARMTGDYAKDVASLPVDLLSFRSTRRIPGQTQDDGGRLFQRTLASAKRAGSGLAGSAFCSEEDFSVTPGHRHRRGDDDHCFYGNRCRDPYGADDLGADPVSSALAPVPSLISTYHLSGRFSTKWSADHSLHPGFGFRVEAWSDDILGWHLLASDWVQADGSWSLTVPASNPFFLGNRLRMLYVTRTSYYDAQDIDGNRYAWRDPDQLHIPTTFDAGHRYADTDGGTYNGVGELVDAAMYTWSRLYWNGGINPVRSSPINLIAPNTGLACGGTSPWSCANGGNIWLIAAHAAQAQVVSHELGHQVNFKFWNDNRPANNGGSHSLNTCYPGREGMTLFEGFADFLAGWVGYPGRNVADGGFGSGRWALGWDLEQRTASPSCTNGWENEVWVARTFWDLHDTRGDGNDVLWFNNLGAVPALYLGNGVASNGDYRDMRYYRTIYRNAASPGHQTYISDIFDQNRQ
jgi:hypothetical protein